MKNTMDTNTKEIAADCQLLEKTLAQFEVPGSITEVHIGPVVTIYELKPQAGIRISAIVNLANDLSMAMGGREIRVIPSLPGKSAIGIEVANRTRKTIDLSMLLNSKEFQEADANDLPIILGVHANGKPMIANLAKMPHLLIAGTTGSGKSVAINDYIMSLIYKLSPDQLQLIMIDPKKLELSAYNGLAHLVLPVITEPLEALRTLNWLLKEMEERYARMANSKVKSLNDYNVKAEADGSMKLSHIVVVIDELADLMMTCGEEIETALVRLAQMARAAGIHLIVATQRPSVDVITGLIKANFPARIAFKVVSKFDSRTILDIGGAEQLLGAGDMLFLNPSKGGELVRGHAAYASDETIESMLRMFGIDVEETV